MLSTVSPLEQGIEPDEGGCISILTEGADLIVA
jgi:hypothetical protein